MRKPTFCADQHLCFRYRNSRITLLSESEISSPWPSSMAVQPGLCQTWLETQTTGLLATRIYTIACFSLIGKVSPVVRKPTFCICENKDADQLRGNREADQRLCFRYIDSTIPLLSKSEISIL